MPAFIVYGALDMTDFLLDLHQRRRIEDAIKDGVNSHKPSPRFQHHVRPSMLGDECVARQWYYYRWVKPVEEDARQRRYFDRGLSEEARIIADLRRDGWEVRDYSQQLWYHPESDAYVLEDWDDPNVSHELVDLSCEPLHIEIALKRGVELRQWSFKKFDDHMKGGCDGKLRHEVHTQNVWGLLEAKTYNKQGFSTLTSKRMRASTPKYVAQATIYMEELKLPFTLFACKSKNDDDYYFEFMTADNEYAQRLDRTAHTVITSTARPARLAESPAFYQCGPKFCAFSGICHKGDPVAINCRSCVHCVSAPEGKFGCNHWNAIIPDDAAILAACPNHTPVK